jgi:hypothetical protein
MPHSAGAVTRRYRYPAKDLSAEAMDKVMPSPGKCLPQEWRMGCPHHFLRKHNRFNLIGSKAGLNSPTASHFRRSIGSPAALTLGYLSAVRKPSG